MKSDELWTRAYEGQQIVVVYSDDDGAPADRAHCCTRRRRDGREVHLIAVTAAQRGCQRQRALAVVRWDPQRKRVISVPETGRRGNAPPRR